MLYIKNNFSQAYIAPIEAKAGSADISVVNMHYRNEFNEMVSKRVEEKENMKMQFVVAKSEFNFFRVKNDAYPRAVMKQLIKREWV